jgi:light-regulated signal transduction histidine kinase (bacteriophytochrome)
VNCEDEPIHLLGKLQSNGLLLGFDSALELSHISENAISLLDDESFPSKTWTLEQILGKEALVRAKTFMSSKELTRSRYERQYQIGTQLYRIHWSKSSDTILLAELEMAEDATLESNTDATLGDLQEFMQNIRHIREEQDLAVQVVLYFRKLTGFDRVMYYKFDHNGDGEVIAEDKKSGLESFLGLRYPASDIPA